MKLSNHDDIIGAIHDRHEVKVTFRSKEDGGAILNRICPPMDYAPRTRAHDKSPVYHFWDVDSDSGKAHTLSLLASQIISVEILESKFDPEDFVTWNKINWAIPRSTWGNKN